MSNRAAAAAPLDRPPNSTPNAPAEDARRATVSSVAPRAKSCIFINLIGGPSQCDLYDPKPKLAEVAGQTLPASLLGDTRFAFVQKETARLMPSRFRFSRHGQCGMELSELLPHLATCADDLALMRSLQSDAFHHHPAELLLNTGSTRFGRPSIGAWLNYGLGSAAENLPGYVVLTCGTGSSASVSNWSNGLLPTRCQGTLFRSRGDAVLHLANPPGVSPIVQENTIAAVRRLNQLRHQQVFDPQLDAWIANHELAFRMQTAAPELLDLSHETAATLNDYGFDRPVPQDLRGWPGGQTETFLEFSRNCLLARRLVERGVRFVNLYHATWDHHSLLERNLPLNCQVIDQPIAALLKDLRRRGLLDTTLVVCASEFGRTPLGENRLGNMQPSGRDHHSQAFSIWLAGGGVRGGQVLGRTDELGWNVVERPVHVHDLHATLLHLFGLDHQRLTFPCGDRHMRLTDVSGAVVPELLA